MKCPKCGSENTKKVYVRDPDWKPGTQRCKDCGHVGDWLLFCGIDLKIEQENCDGDSGRSALSGVDSAPGER